MLGLFSHKKDNENTLTTTIDEDTKLLIKLVEPPYYSRLYFYRNENYVSDVTIDFDGVQQIVKHINQFKKGEITKMDLLNTLFNCGLKFERADDAIALGAGS